MEGLQAIIGELRDRYETLDVQRLLQSQQERSEQHLVFVDRNALTDRQIEVLETAHRMGYFEHPKRANAGEVADELDITSTTFTEHLAAAQTKLLDAILDDE
jgi:predicted DNA binding protein